MKLNNLRKNIIIHLNRIIVCIIVCIVLIKIREEEKRIYIFCKFILINSQIGKKKEVLECSMEEERAGLNTKVAGFPTTRYFLFYHHHICRNLIWFQ